MTAFCIRYSPPATSVLNLYRSITGDPIMGLHPRCNRNRHAWLRHPPSTPGQDMTGASPLLDMQNSRRHQSAILLEGNQSS